MKSPTKRPPGPRRAGPGPAVSLVAVLAAGCATARGPGLDPAAGVEADRRVAMDPIVVRAGVDPLTGLDGYDAAQLLEVGNRLLEQGEPDRALRCFRRLVGTFADSPLVPAASYNAGLALERLEEHEAALAEYDTLAARHAGTPSGRDALFRRPHALAKLARWREVADSFWNLRQRGDLSPMDELEARVGQGVGHFMEGDHATAEREFLAAVRFAEDRGKQEYLPADYFVGQARFYLGEIAARAFEAARLEPPRGPGADWAARMGKELEDKCEQLLRAQNHFIRTIRVGHAGWATAAGYRIGSLYERLYEDLMSVPVPPELDEEASKAYRAQLREKIGVLVVKAIQVYERSLEMANRVGEKNEWVERTTRSLERMKSLYLESLDGA
jgi:tetratricopeptide (TPR) repeat protein